MYAFKCYFSWNVLLLLFFLLDKNRKMLKKKMKF